MTSSPRRPLRVVKLGGSLLDWPDFPARLWQWRSRQTPAVDVLLPGGGGFADCLRRADTLHGLGESASHHLCLQALQLTAQLTARLLPEAVGPLAAEQIRTLDAAGLVLLDAVSLARLDLAESVQPLPETWQVTTDSLAARAAVLLSADELVLLKSTLPERPQSLEALAAAGVVDEYFPHCASRAIPIRLVNLRSDDFAEHCLPGAKNAVR